MLANIIIGGVIFGWVGFCVYKIIRRKINAKKNGTIDCGCGCSGCNGGSCSKKS